MQIQMVALLFTYANVFFIFYKVTKKTRSAAHRSIVKVCWDLPTLLNKTKKGERVTLEVSETHLENVA